MPEPADQSRVDGERLLDGQDRSRPASGVIEAGAFRSVSIDHAAGLLNVSRRTIYNYIRAGRLVTIRTPLGSQRVLRTSLERA